MSKLRPLADSSDPASFSNHTLHASLGQEWTLSQFETNTLTFHRFLKRLASGFQNGAMRLSRIVLSCTSDEDLALRAILDISTQQKLGIVRIGARSGHTNEWDASTLFVNDEVPSKAKEAQIAREHAWFAPLARINGRAELL
jgi:hypothetical protein